MVTILKSIGPYNSGTKDNIQHYYTRTVNVQNLLFENKLPDAFRITAQPPEKDIDKTLQIAFEIDPESENKTPKVQPYEGDRIFESRFGSIIRTIFLYYPIRKSATKSGQSKLLAGCCSVRCG